MLLSASVLPAVSIVATKSTATELNGLTTGAGKFTFTRTGATTDPLTVQYTIDAASTAVNGTDYNTGSSLSGTIIIEAGSASVTLMINPVDTGLADGPKRVILDLATTGTSPEYTLGSKHQATVTIVDHAPTVTLTATKASASEITGQTTGAGVFTFKRSGSLSGPLTVDFTVAGTATEGTDYTALSLHTVNFSAGQAVATVLIRAIDDRLTEGTEKVTLTLAADGSPGSYHFKPTTATVNIADDTRPILLGTITPIPGGLKNTPLAITYADLVTATDPFDRAGKAILFKIKSIAAGGLLTKNGAPILLNKTTIAAGESIVWTPPTGKTGTLAAFTLLATDGSKSTASAAVSVIVGGAGVIPHPQMEVLPAALDQPQINAIIYVGNNSTPQIGQTSTIDPLTLDTTYVNTFNVTGYLDTGASGILISNPTNSVEKLPTLSSNGTPVIYSDVGVAGSDDFQVSDLVRLSLASFYQRTDLDQFSDANDTVPITMPYTPIPSPSSSVRVQIGPFTPTVDNPITDDFSDLFSDLSAVDVIGMPAMQGRVTVIDPTRVNNLGTLFDQLLSDPDHVDLSALDADMSVHSFIYAPGTPFHSSTTATDPGIPATSLHVKLSYADFGRFTQVTPDGQPGPTLVHNPIIGMDPVRLMDGTAQPSNPGIRITRDISVPDGQGGTTTQTLASEGNWLLDTGAAATIISKAQAAALDVTYKDGTFGTDNPVLVDQNGDPLPNQFQLAIGGIGGQETLAGFYLDSLTVRTQEGNAANNSDPNHLVWVHEPVLVGDVSVKDPATGQTLTLDGIFGMNNLIGSADFSLDPTSGDLSDLSTANGFFNWITFDEPSGVLGLSIDPAALAAASAVTAAAKSAVPQVSSLAPQTSSLVSPTSSTSTTLIISSALDSLTSLLADVAITPVTTSDPTTLPVTQSPTSDAATLLALTSLPQESALTPATADPALSLVSLSSRF